MNNIGHCYLYNFKVQTEGKGIIMEYYIACPNPSSSKKTGNIRDYRELSCLSMLRGEIFQSSHLIGPVLIGPNDQIA